MRALPLGGVALVAAAAVTAASCPEPHLYPGTQIATFDITATPSPGGLDECRDAGYVEIPDSGFSFWAIFSGIEDGTIQYMTIQDYVREATFDGRIITSPYSAPRVFDLCGDAGVDEDLQVTPISLTQSQALGGQCPDDPLAPGAIPLDPDAGIFGPGWVNGHFEAVSACGRLRDTIHEAGDRPCPVCTLQFNLTGIRR